MADTNKPAPGDAAGEVEALRRDLARFQRDAVGYKQASKAFKAERDEARRLLAETRAERDAAQAKAEARFDCHGGPDMAEPFCGGCASCLTRTLDAAERERDEARAEVARAEEEAAVLRAERDRLADLRAAASEEWAREREGLRAEVARLRALIAPLSFGLETAEDTMARLAALQADDEARPCPDCPHPRGRHAYNGCADCIKCSRTWKDWPARASQGQGQGQAPAGPWRVVTEAEPAPGVRVLFLCAGVVEDGWRNAQGWWALPGWRRDGASHWMPLPAAPAAEPTPPEEK